MNSSILNFCDGFNELVQVFIGFAFGLAFSQANLSVGWIFFWIVTWELGVYLIFGRTKYYNPFFRVVYNCIFLISILVGQYVYFGKTTFQNFLYPDAPQTKSAYSGKKYNFMETMEERLDKLVNGEEEDAKKKKLKRRFKYLFYHANT